MDEYTSHTFEADYDPGVVALLCFSPALLVIMMFLFWFLGTGFVAILILFASLLLILFLYWVVLPRYILVVWCSYTKSLTCTYLPLTFHIIFATLFSEEFSHFSLVCSGSTSSLVEEWGLFWDGHSPWQSILTPWKKCMSSRTASHLRSCTPSVFWSLLRLSPPGFWLFAQMEWTCSYLPRSHLDLSAWSRSVCHFALHFPLLSPFHSLPNFLNSFYFYFWTRAPTYKTKTILLIYYFYQRIYYRVYDISSWYITRIKSIKLDKIFDPFIDSIHLQREKNQRLSLTYLLVQRPTPIVSAGKSVSPDEKPLFWPECWNQLSLYDYFTV